MKRALVGMLCLAMLLTGGWTVLAEEAQTPEDVAFAMQVTQTIADLGDNPDIGNRSSGSAAERQAAEFIEKTMKEIGLQNVTVDSFTADTWSLTGAGCIIPTPRASSSTWCWAALPPSSRPICRRSLWSTRAGARPRTMRAWT